jgi:uncharacterized protein DUF3105
VAAVPVVHVGPLHKGADPPDAVRRANPHGNGTTSRDSVHKLETRERTALPAPYHGRVAKKSQVPKPPRPVQAPKRREDPKGAASRWLSAVPRWIYLVVAAILIAAIAGAVFAFAGGSKSSKSDVASTMAAAGCTYRQVVPFKPTTKTGGYHGDVPTLSTKVKWSTFPPSAGAHYQLWAVWGFYRTPVNPRNVVHNEEHGAVVLWWGPKVPSTTVDKLEKFYDSSPGGMFGTPIAGLGSKIALTAWTGDPAKYSVTPNGNHGIGHIAICPNFDQHAFETFRDAFRGKGPEGIPLQYDQPGMGPQ